MELNPDLRRLAATQAKRTAASDLRHCATGAGRYQCCEHDILQTNKPILLLIGTSGPRGKGMMKRSTLGVRRSKFKVTGVRS